MATQTVMLTAQTRAALISTANTQTNGTGPMSQIFVGGAVHGSCITSVTVKALNNTTAGMVRLFLSNGASKFLLEEFQIPANTINANYGILETFSSTLTFPMGDFKVAAGWSVEASTQNAEPFNVIAEGYDLSYCPC